MKTNSIFKLYKSYYPQATVASVTFAETGGIVQMSDAARSFRLNIMPCKTPGDLPSSEPLARGELYRQFVSDNRRELFMLRETRCLYGIVYAESFTSDLKMIDMFTDSTTLPRRQSQGGVSLTYLLTLGDKVKQRRYAVTSVTLERNGMAVISAGRTADVSIIRVHPGGTRVTYMRGGYHFRSHDEEVERYARLFWRDNAEWFANFAAGREDLL